ncbi:hypothetical protein FACS189490_12810 [Clostridia bacterium]|nr:hypothetical protein FACS189490_12810 [Clostridia bacterium]
MSLTAKSSFEVGKIAEFGSYDWRVIEVHDGKALLLSSEVIRTDNYNPSKGCTSWDICALRDWLNIDFYDEFGEREQERIAEVCVTTAKNPRFDTHCGEVTLDKVFLLSIEEVARYFGDSGQLTGGNPKSKWWINDQYNETRIAYDESGTVVWWWLRTPGMHTNTVVYVNTGGSINLAGHRAYNSDGGVRPAMWVKL